MSIATTTLLYICITISTTLLASFDGKVLFRIRKKRIDVFLLLAFLIHFVFYCFTDIGSDYSNYVRIISEYSMKYHPGWEPGSAFLMVILNSIFGNSNLVIFIYKAISIAVLYHCLSISKERIIPWVFILSFNALTFLYLFVVIRMALAISFFSISVYYLLEKQSTKSIAFILLASLTHYSAVLIIPAYIAYFVLTSSKHTIRVFVIFIVSLILILIVSRLEFIYSFLLKNISFISMYKNHGFIQADSGSGMLLFFTYAFMGFFAFETYCKSNDIVLVNVTMILLVYSLFITLLGYRINVFSRMNYYFFVLPGICFSSFLRNNREKRQLYDLFLRGLLVLYLIVRFALILKDFMTDYSLTQIHSYHFFWPF